MQNIRQRLACKCTKADDGTHLERVLDGLPAAANKRDDVGPPNDLDEAHAALLENTLRQQLAGSRVKDCTDTVSFHPHLGVGGEKVS